MVRSSDIFRTAFFWMLLWKGGYEKFGWGSGDAESKAVSWRRPGGMSFAQRGNVRG